MKRSRLLALIPVFSLISSFSLGEIARPNILYLYVDDMGWGALGPNGQFERAKKGLPHLITPNLDRLAREGVNFTRSYGCTVCSPARSSQQTGFHQGHTYADQNDPDNAKKAMRSDDVLMGDVMSGAGYVTGYWGKWGYGGSANKDPMPEILNVQTLPTSHGYQHVLAELHHVRAHTFFQPTLWKAPAFPGSKGGLELVPNSMERYAKNARYPNKPALQNHIEYPEIAYCDDLYAFHALDFVRVQSQNYNATNQPFFGILACQIPHAPFRELERLPEWDQAYRKYEWFSSLSDQARQWAAMITRIDGHIGNILDALEDPNGDGYSSDSVLEKTLIVFQSDNGGPGDNSLVEFKSNGPLSGQKGRIQEGGIRIPTLMRLPESFASKSTLKAGTSTDRIVDVTDLLPTFSELAGVAAPVGIDGVSIAPTLTGTGRQRVREFLIHEAGNGQSIIRGDFKLVRSKQGLSLFNLAEDPGESNDLSSKKVKMVKELEAIMLAERVDEPKGFANTYHHWIGERGANPRSADNWSKYTYANAGITYMTDEGAPRASWTARIDNGEPLILDSSLEFLSLEIGGDSKRQDVSLRSGATLTARNGIRINSNSAVRIEKATVDTVRWVDVQPGASLIGSGVVNAEINNSGRVVVAESGLSTVSFFCEADALFGVAIGKENAGTLKVKGEAALSGQLEVILRAGSEPESGQTYTVLQADKVVGSFDNDMGEAKAANGAHFKIGYTKNSVTLTAL